MIKSCLQCHALHHAAIFVIGLDGWMILKMVPLKQINYVQSNLTSKANEEVCPPTFQSFQNNRWHLFKFL
jgi:hypothetical protein